MNRLNSDAAFDTLVICRELEPVANGATESEVHLFAYLACLLFVYKGAPPSDWRYQFTATKSMAPYSTEIAEAIDQLARVGLLERGDKGYVLTEKGVRELESFALMAVLARRREFLEGACGSSLVIPLPAVGASLSAEPQLHKAMELSSTRPLLDAAGREAIFDHFDALSRAVPDATDLMVPAVLWLEYLASTIPTGPEPGCEETVVGGA